LIYLDSSLEEIVVVFWIWEILGILLTLQQAGIIHGDFSLHNFYLKKTSTVQDRFNPTGKGGWGQFGLVLLDWACSIDMEAFPPGQKFEITASNDPSSIDNECYEFRNGGTWTWEPDYYGTACILHLLMFGTPLETNEGDFSKPNLNIKKEIPNGWNQSLWNRLFLVLLNTIDKEKIKMIRLEMEQYLIENSGSKHLSELLISFE
jgi:checkpoint serine/threonine-protein kinase